jgi:hypothetical protein
MKNNKFPQTRNDKAVVPARPPMVAELKAGEAAFVPSADEVARRAYFSYVNQGSRPGQDVQHWLEAEAQMLAERNLTRVHGQHNRT